MKKLSSVLCALFLLGIAASAQNTDKKSEKRGNDWREKVRSEQVACITTELNLTEAEAQAFWPVYNDVQARRRDAFKTLGDATKALQDAAEGADYNALLNNYIAAKKQADALEIEALNRYKAVLSIDKVAKLVVAEERFRQQQISRLGQGGGRHGGPGEPGPGHGRGQRPAPTEE